jgi:hypothetical protein
MFLHPWKIILRNLAIVLAILGSYLWVSADDWALELEQQQMAEQRIRAQAELEQLARAGQEPEFEPDWESIKPQEPQPVFQQAQRAIKKQTVRAKQRLSSAKN